MTTLDLRVSAAIRAYWETRSAQDKKQGTTVGAKDQGNRAAVTGGAQLDGFIELIRTMLVECGIPDASVHTKQAVVPGFYRPTKEWDLLVLADGSLLATVEVKSHAGPSFGNNFNNRVEEALGNATDFWAAYENGAFKPSGRPFLGYLMLLEEEVKSVTPVRERKRPLFPLLEEYVNSSYADRYALFCRKVLRDRLYDAACLLLSNREAGRKGMYREPDSELSFANFSLGLRARAIAFAKGKGN